jgi:hypothetical protein
MNGKGRRHVLWTYAVMPALSWLNCARAQQVLLGLSILQSLLVSADKVIE